jgi:hypothetical protein
MIRMVRNLGLVAALLLLPLSTQAIEISVSASSTGGNTSVLMPGDIITFDISLAHASGEDIFGLGVGVAGYDRNQNGFSDDGLTFLGPNQQNSTIPDFVPVDTSGTANVADFIFGVDDGGGNQVPGTGLTNVRGSLQTPTFIFLPKELTGQPVDLHRYLGSGLGAFEFGYNDPIQDLLGNPPIVERHVTVFDGITTAPGFNGQPPTDLTPEVAPGVQFRISFEATPAAIETVPHTRVFGEQAEFGQVAIGNGGEVLGTYQSDSFSFSVIPEPGTALLMGLGLAGLAAQRRR